MIRKILALAVMLSFFASAAVAQTCSTLPNNLTNGTTADATQVMANFNSILTCANTNLAPLANPHFTGGVGIGTTNVTGSLTVSGATDRMLNVRGDPASFGLPSGLLGPILQGVNSAQTLTEPLTVFASSINLRVHFGSLTQRASLRSRSTLEAA